MSADDATSVTPEDVVPKTAPVKAQAKPYRAPRPKQTRPAGPRSKPSIKVGGVEATYDQVVEALEILKASKGIMVRQPLLKAGNPLYAFDYHQVANHERTFPGSEKLSTKSAVILALKKLTGR